MTSTSSARNKTLKPRASSARSRRSGASARRRPPSPPKELREAGLAARKSLGQHFLTSKRALRRIAEAVEASPQETVIEVGAGLGGLTAELAKRAGRVVAVELDASLADYLRRRFAGTNVSVVQEDALAVRPDDVLGGAGGSGRYSVAGNLPYYVAQPLLRHFLEAQPPPRRLVVMVQAEVARSIVAGPGQMSLLGVSVQLYGEPRQLFRVPPSAFYPPPRVQSAVVRIDVARRSRAGVVDTQAFFRVARAGFGTRRKQLRNSLANGLGIEPAAAAELTAAAGVDGTLRPQALRLEDWAALATAWVAAGQPGGAS